MNIGIAYFTKWMYFSKLLCKANWLAVIFVDVLLLFLVDQFMTVPNPQFSAVSTSRLSLSGKKSDL